MKNLIYLLLLSFNLFAQAPEVPADYGHSYGDTSGFYVRYYESYPVANEINTVAEKLIIRCNNCTVIDSEGYYIVRADQLRNMDTVKIDSDNTIALPDEEDNFYINENSDNILVLGGKYIGDKFYPDPWAINGNNLFRDDCGQWWEEVIEVGEWKSKKPEVQREKFKIGDYLEYPSGILPNYYPCNNPTDKEETEYKLDKENKIEYSRIIKYTYKKIE